MALDTDHLLARASIRGLFDPSTIVANLPDREAALVFLAQRSTERQLGDRWLWMLDLDSRGKGLSSLPDNRKQLHQFLDANPPECGDVVGRMFQRVLRANSRQVAMAEVTARTGHRISSLSSDEQVSLFQVVSTLVDANAKVLDWIDEDAARSIRRSADIKDRLNAQQTLLPDAFRGRHRERRFLRTFVTRGVNAAKSETPRIAAVVPHRYGSIPVAVVAGIGGVGKSALLADVTRELIKRRAATAILFDFDNPSLRQGNILAMAMEFSRQLGLAEPEVDVALSRSRIELRHAAARTTEIGSFESVSSVMLGTYSDWRNALDGRPILDRPLVLVLDTFEEVVAISSERLGIIAEWARELTGVGFRRLSIVLSGRAVEDLDPPDDSPLQIVAKLQLGDLGVRAGKSKLGDLFRRYGVYQQELVPQLVRAFGSNPLVLEVLARFCRGKNTDEIQSLLTGSEAGQPLGDGPLGAQFAQRFLYSRILERVPDEDMRKLARPGLVMRRVTPEIILEVLAGPCELGNVDLEMATGLLERLKRIAWLVQPGGGPDEALHRKDLRRLMLPLLLPESAAQRVVHQAVEWLSGRNDPQERLEALYYRGLAGEALEDIDDEQLSRLGNLVGADIDDLPLSLRARIKRSSGMKLRAEEIDALPDEQRASVLASRAATLTSEGFDEAAFGVDQQRGAASRPRGVGATPPPPGRPDADADADADADVWRYELQSSTGTQSRLNTRRFMAAASAAVPLLRHLLRSLAEGTLGGVEPKRPIEALGHPAYLAAIATFASDRNAAREEISRFLKTMRGGRSLGRAIKLGLARPIDGTAPAALALLCAHAIGIDLREIPGFDQLDRKLDLRWPSATSQSTWRLAVLLARYGLLQSAQPSLGVFPLLSSTISELIAGKGLSIPGSSSDSSLPRGDIQVRPSRMEDLLKEVEASGWPTSGGRVDQSAVTRMTRMSEQATLIFDFDGQRAMLPEHLGLGRAPELRGPLRTGLMRLEKRQLVQLVEKMSRGGGLWPTELNLRFVQQDDSLKTAPPIVEAIDDSGQWGDAIGFLPPEPDTSALIDGVRRLWSDIHSTQQSGRSV